MNTDLTYSDVSRLLRADFETGKLFWLPRTPDLFSGAAWSDEHSCNNWNAAHAGQEAFTALDGYGYLHGRIFDRPYKAHRIIWLLHTGDWPAMHLDHINGNRADNSIANLRAVTRTENMMNTRIRSDNTSGVVGVCWDGSRGKWLATICVARKYRHLGRFDDLDEAIAVRKAAEIEMGFHPNHGRAA